MKLDNYYKLSEILNYDTYMVAVVVHHFIFNCEDEISDIYDNLVKLNIEKIEVYNQAINEALEVPIEELSLLNDEAVFKSEVAYIRYLKSLLELNGIEYMELKLKVQKKAKFIGGSLF